MRVAGGADRALSLTLVAEVAHKTVDLAIEKFAERYGIVGKKAGTVTGFAYTDSLWHHLATLDNWIADPESVVTNNKMKPYTGMTDASARAAIITFLKQGAQEK